MSAILYPLMVFCIRTYKSIELRLFRLMTPKIERVVKSRFRKAGITINGPNAWDPQIKDKEFYTRVACDSTLGFGEAYMDGLWECEALDQLSYRFFNNGLYKRVINVVNRLLNYLLFRVFNLQTKARAWEVGVKHYDQGNEFFESFLDPSMNYSCGYWRTADNLNQAQQDKMELIAKKLKLKPGMRVLDIGCGWGGLCKYLAEKYKVQVVGCTISIEGAKYGQKLCAGLLVDIRLVDYREINEKFDRIVSVGMFEHVGPANYRTFFEVTNKCLEDDGIFLLHTIGVNHPVVVRTEPWFHTYIFPNGILPYHTDIPTYTDGLFVMEDWHNMGHDYSRTLMAWYDNFVKAWPKLSGLRDERFFRMWKYYLLMAAGGFRSRRYQLWQVVLTKNGYKGGYESVR